MIDMESKLFELLDSCKAELLDGIPKENQLDLIMGFLMCEKNWLEHIMEEYGEENFIASYIKEKDIRQEGLKIMANEEKMRYYMADKTLSIMVEIHKYLGELHDQHHFIGYSATKEMLNATLSLFEKCKSYSKDDKCWLLYVIIQDLKLVSPISFFYLIYRLHKLKKCGKMPRDAHYYHPYQHVSPRA